MQSPSSVQFAQKAAIVQGSRILMVRKSSDDPHNPDLWELPGGRMNFGEDIEQHLSREVKEEVGLVVQPGRPLHIWSWVMQREGEAPVQVVAVVRMCTVTSGEVSCKNQDSSDYISSIQWHDFETLDRLQVIASQRDAINLAIKETMVPQLASDLSCPVPS
ncbi:MAG: NUDIX domain-containing protein [Pseudonocardiaceae bacterium]